MDSPAVDRRSWITLGTLLTLSACSGCPQGASTRIVVQRFSIADESLAAAPELGLGAPGFQQLLEQALTRQGAIVGKGQSGPRPFRMRAEVEFARASEGESPDGGAIEEQVVGVALELIPLTGDHPARIVAPAMGLASTRVHPEPDARGAAFQSALKEAIDHSAATLVRTAEAQERQTAALEAELQSPDAGIREAAADVLVDRKDPAAIPVLMTELSDPDSRVRMKAVGELVELKATEAVPKLIDLAEAHDPGQPNDPHLQIQIIYALGSIGGEEAEAFLYTLGSGHPEPEVRHAAQEASSELRAGAGRLAGTSGGAPPRAADRTP